MSKREWEIRRIHVHSYTRHTIHGERLTAGSYLRCGFFADVDHVSANALTLSANLSTVIFCCRYFQRLTCQSCTNAIRCEAVSAACSASLTPVSNTSWDKASCRASSDDLAIVFCDVDSVFDSMNTK